MANPNPDPQHPDVYPPGLGNTGAIGDADPNTVNASSRDTAEKNKDGAKTQPTPGEAIKGAQDKGVVPTPKK